MKFGRDLLMAVTFVLLTTAAGLSEDLYYDGYDGTWQGKLKTHSVDLTTFGEKPNSASDAELSLEIKGADVRVFVISKEGNRSEVKKGQFRLAVHKTNAIIYATDSSSDVFDKTGSGGWVETWNFTATHKDRNTIYVAWARSVNNYLRPPWRERRGEPFVRSGFGEMTRAK